MLLCRPRVSDLLFCVYRRALHPELFEVLSGHRVERGDFLLHMWVTRSGHVLTWTDGKHQLTEVVASQQDALPEGWVVRLHLRGERLAEVVGVAGVRYQAGFQEERLSPEIFLHLHDEIVEDGQREGFFVPWGAGGRTKLTPVSYLHPQARPGSLVVYAFHTFPEEYTIIKTQSLIESVR
ncbi:MAG: DUF2617 family protein [Gemmatales bacterium]|nr:DUF2617 family protein [Gemmatales bacterium]MCS7159150.1 DUF2617 family protein [Gemmatales bacterium]MDW8174350.1 DUF2617 family protein [Gemmatales bacterium]MDW8221442.1 DUF2617 family protein [Gemmatales bacterium]